MASNCNYFIGVDPGFTGGLALLSADGLIARVWPMPTTGKRNHRKLDLGYLTGIIRTFPPNSQVGLEWPQGLPGDSPQSMMRFGVQVGQIDALLYAHEFLPEHISPSVWKGRLGLPGKAHDPSSWQGVQYWAERYPSHSGLIHGPRGGILDGLLDALLLAHYLKLGTTSPMGWHGGKRPPAFRGVPS